MAHHLDTRLIRLAKAAHLTYSRYVDDLTFSTNQKAFPFHVAKPSEGDPSQWLPGESVAAAVANAGFLINPDKTRMQVRGSRQVVTGLPTVNTKVNISQAYWRSLRSMCHSLYQSGEYHVPLSKSEKAKGSLPLMINKLDPLAGMLSHVYHVKRRSGHLPDRAKEYNVYGHADHARFWFYESFVACNRPLIICEGVTDNIYLRNAMRQLSASHPSLAIKDADGFKFGVTLFSYENVVHRILELTGGIGQIWKFIYGYRTALKAYKFKPLLSPVIVLIDNDLWRFRRRSQTL